MLTGALGALLDVFQIACFTEFELAVVNVVKHLSTANLASLRGGKYPPNFECGLCSGSGNESFIGVEVGLDGSFLISQFSKMVE